VLQLRAPPIDESFFERKDCVLKDATIRVCTMSGGKGKTWLQLYIDAMTEKDPYKRLALVRALRSVPKGMGKSGPGGEKKKVSQQPRKKAKKSRSSRLAA
jgi:hypothetical protein